MTADDSLYVRFKGRTIGPLSLADTKNLVRRGQVTPLHEISGDGLSWRSAQEHPDLFAKQSKAAIETVAQPELKSQVLAPTITHGEWHVHIDGANLGPLQESEIKQWIASGKIQPATLVWREGMDDWQEVQSACPSWVASLSMSASHRSGKPEADNEELRHVVFAILQSHVWAVFLAVLGLCVFAAQSALWLALFLMNVATKGAVGNTIISVTVFAFSVAAFIGSVLLMRYVNSVGVLRYQPTSTNLHRALARLASFWKYTGILLLVTLSIVGVLLFFAYLSGLGVAQFFSPDKT